MNTSHQQARRASGQLFLLFSMGADRYALDVRDVLEVLPLRRLKQIPEAPAWVAGLFSRHGQPVPVVDLHALAFGQPARARTSTRLVLVRYQAQAGGAPQALGLILEQATDTLRCAPDAFRDSGVDSGTAAYLGPVYEHASGLVQRVGVAELLPPAVRTLLFPQVAPVQELGA